jgi:hypothetical protein
MAARGRPDPAPDPKAGLKVTADDRSEGRYTSTVLSYIDLKDTRAGWEYFRR